MQNVPFQNNVHVVGILQIRISKREVAFLYPSVQRLDMRQKQKTIQQN